MLIDKLKRWIPVIILILGCQACSISDSDSRKRVLLEDRLEVKEISISKLEKDKVELLVFVKADLKVELDKLEAARRKIKDKLIDEKSKLMEERTEVWKKNIEKKEKGIKSKEELLKVKPEEKLKVELEECKNDLDKKKNEFELNKKQLADELEEYKKNIDKKTLQILFEKNLKVFITVDKQKTYGEESIIKKEGLTILKDGMIRFSIELSKEINKEEVSLVEVSVKFPVKDVSTFIESRAVQLRIPARETKLKKKSGPNEQPLIEDVIPDGGIQGDSITVVGHNFGNNIDNIVINFEDTETEQNNPYKFKLLYLADPFYLANKSDKTQELKFTIPPGLLGKMKKRIFSKKLHIYINLHGRHSNRFPLAVVKDNWRIKAAAMSVLLMLFFLLIIFLMAKKFEFLVTLFKDTSTNTYSLSKCQAFAWTILLCGCYFYQVIGTGLILGFSKIPAFNTSLLVLMGISYGGLVTAKGIGFKQPKNDPHKTQSRLSDLISENGEISLPRMQLFLFTIITIIVYLYILTGADVIRNGLPDIPASLLSLMGISQGGYLGGKFVKDSIAVQHIDPAFVLADQKNITVTIIGNGFKDNTKALFENRLMDTRFIDANSLELTIPEFETPGKKQFILLSPDGGRIGLNDNFFEVLEKT
ncbi:MAG: hypothetical protein GY754_17120 [bacterium]|nr:hypothetical protein [bacterium]